METNTIEQTLNEQVAAAKLVLKELNEQKLATLPFATMEQADQIAAAARAGEGLPYELQPGKSLRLTDDQKEMVSKAKTARKEALAMPGAKAAVITALSHKDATFTNYGVKFGKMGVEQRATAVTPWHKLVPADVLKGAYATV